MSDKHKYSLYDCDFCQKKLTTMKLEGVDYIRLLVGLMSSPRILVSNAALDFEHVAGRLQLAPQAARKSGDAERTGTLLRATRVSRAEGG